MSQALYRKWRPARFDDVVGQEHVTRTLRNAVASGRDGHAYLFCGPRGTGKTTTARLLAKAVNCLDPDPAQRPCNQCAVCRSIRQGRYLDLIEIDAASNTGVDDIRDLRDKINFSPSDGRYKVYIIDEVHMLSTAAFNALLKTLEEPPDHAKFVLATTEEHKVPLTIKSRCQQFNFRLLTTQEIVGRLQWMAEQENLTIEPDALTLIARQGAGSIRDAESLLDQLVTAPGDTITLERVQRVLGTATAESVSKLTDAWLAANAPAGLAIIHQALASGADARQFSRQMVDYLRQVLLLHTVGDDLVLDAAAETRETMVAQAQRADRERLIDAIKNFNNAALASSSSWQPQLPLELAFIELLPADAAPAVPEIRPPSRTEAPRPGADEAVPPQTTKPEPEPEPAPTPEPESEPEQATPEPVVQAQEAQAQETQAQAAEPEPEPEPTPEPAPAETEAPAGDRAAITLDAVKHNWRQMVRRVGEEDKNLPALLAMSKPLATEGNTLVLGFDFPVLKDKFDDKAEAKELVAATLSDLLGSKCTLRCVVSGKYTPAPSPSRPGRQSTPSNPEMPTVSKDEFHALAQELGGRVREP